MLFTSNHRARPAEDTELLCISGKQHIDQPDLDCRSEAEKGSVHGAGSASRSGIGQLEMTVKTKGPAVLSKTPLSILFPLVNEVHPIPLYLPYYIPSLGLWIVA